MRPNQKQTEAFRAFLDWCRFYDLPMPVGGEEVAEYLLELLTDGATLAGLKAKAKSIVIGYAERRTFLDLAPIRAAIKIAEAQLAPGRVLN